MVAGLRSGYKSHYLADKTRFPDWGSDAFGRVCQNKSVNGIASGISQEGRIKKCEVLFYHPNEPEKSVRNE